MFWSNGTLRCRKQAARTGAYSHSCTGQNNNRYRGVRGLDARGVWLYRIAASLVERPDTRRQPMHVNLKNVGLVICDVAHTCDGVVPDRDSSRAHTSNHRCSKLKKHELRRSMILTDLRAQANCSHYMSSSWALIIPSCCAFRALQVLHR